MNKKQAIAKCRELLGRGIYAMPVYDRVHRDWMVRINHNAQSFGYSLDDLRFSDCAYNPHDYKIQDYPLFFQPSIWRNY